MKRLIGALLVGGAVFGTVWAAAATLDVDGGTLQMSSAVDATCDSTGVTLGYLFSDSDADPATDNDMVTEAQVGGIHDDCVGDVLTVELFAGSTKCDEAEATIAANGIGSDDNSLVLPLGTTEADTCSVLEVTTSFVNIASPADWGP
ncbi:MAG: hypothetical protein Q7T33_10955 [Dehalococcoidia bacterium]|nr:hypothetical protein [Dehalococcoidia bacterium]